MRRKDREITDPEIISRIIRKCQVCRLGLAKDNMPYIVPVSFGYDGTDIYFHTAGEGKKIDVITANNAVCFEFEHGVQLAPDEGNPCQWTFYYQSVIGNGRVQELVDSRERIEGLNQIMQHYSGQEWPLSETQLKGIRVWKIKVETITGKQSKAKTAT
jgi:nitroimidazol reductase NimA-like FMN-containing flavoprotein (pyridoxamine 5'-phosphate oxidase superfamily)